MYYSQIGQDKWVHSILGDKKNGFFIELGASNGVYLSNTLFFEKELNWNGICIEPNPQFKNDLQRNRNCNLCFNCISDSNDKKIEFSICQHASGVIETIGPFTQTDNIIYIETRTLDSVLTEFNSPNVIDYLSLDVEGHEYEILKSFPFDKYIINCITVEHNEPHIGSEMRMKIREILEKNNYIFIKGNDDVCGWNHGPIDDFYVHTSIKL